VQTFDDDGELAFMAKQMIIKLQLIAKLHGKINKNASKHMFNKNKHLLLIG